MLFCRLLIFSKSPFSKNSFRNTFRVPNCLDPDQARQDDGPGMDPNLLKRLSADDTCKQRIKELINIEKILKLSFTPKTGNGSCPICKIE